VIDSAARDATVPDVNGQDAATVRRKLEKLGLTDVSMSSTNPMYGVVMLESCWTAVSIQPPPGTVVGSGDPVVVQVYKD
jgi:beta-lactam-binding protein with PASTA domain